VLLCDSSTLVILPLSLTQKKLNNIIISTAITLFPSLRYILLRLLRPANATQITKSYTKREHRISPSSSICMLIWGLYANIGLIFPTPTSLILTIGGGCRFLNLLFPEQKPGLNGNVPAMSLLYAFLIRSTASCVILEVTRHHRRHVYSAEART